MGASEYDYIIVGAGASGCVIANRLSAHSDISVLLIEAGPPDTNPNIHRPAGLFKLFDGSLTWNYRTVPQTNLNGRVLDFVQGRVLGGGSSVNGLVFTRGCPEDYDAWATDFASDGWSFSELLPYFRRAERNDMLVGDFHGTEGPQGISTMSPDPLTPRLHPGLPAGRNPVHGRFQRLKAGRRRNIPDVHLERPSLLYSHGIPSPRDRTDESFGPDRVSGEPVACRRRARDRCGSFVRWVGPDTSRRTRSNRGGRCHRLAQADDAFWHWRGGPTARRWRGTNPRPSRSWTEPAGPSGYRRSAFRRSRAWIRPIQGSAPDALGRSSVSAFRHRAGDINHRGRRRILDSRPLIAKCRYPAPFRACHWNRTRFSDVPNRSRLYVQTAISSDPKAGDLSGLLPLIQPRRRLSTRITWASRAIST